jgi:hypothetical protein
VVGGTGSTGALAPGAVRRVAMCCPEAVVRVVLVTGIVVLVINPQV